MFPNLQAEQARKGHTNEYLAKLLGITRHTLKKRKTIGDFKLNEITMLLSLYTSDFDYLFANEQKISHAKATDTAHARQ